MDKQPACTEASHAAIRLDPARWEAETVFRSYWELGGEMLIIANCLACNSTLARPAETVEVEVAA